MTHSGWLSVVCSTLGGDLSSLSMPVVTAFGGTLLEQYGQHKVVDVFKDTGMEVPAADLGMGAWVVSGAIGDEHTLEWHRQLIDSLTRIANRDGVRAVQLKGTNSCGTARSSVRLGVVRASMITRALPKPLVQGQQN